MLYTINGITLYWFVEVNQAGTVATVFVRKPDDLRSTNIPFDGTTTGGAEKYPVFSVGSTGECWRHKGLPTGWGFWLTKDRKIKEVR